MRCPACKSELIVGGQKHLETVGEHAFCQEPSLKNFYLCSNPDCNCSKLKVMWDEWGGYYTGKNWKDAQNIQFIDNNNGAFGSVERESQVTIYKKDENKKIKLPFNWIAEIEYKYTADQDGNVLTKKPTLQLWKPEHDGMHSHYITGISMLVFMLKEHYNKFHSRTDKKDYEWPPSYFKNDWWRWIVPFLLRIIDNKNFRLTEMEN